MNTSYNVTQPHGISWKAIFAGTAVAISVMLILNLIGLAIGLWSFEPTEEGNPLKGIGTGSLVWWVFSNLLVLFAGGFVAARFGSSFLKTNGIIQGFLTWSLYTLISAWLLTSAIGSIISGVGKVVGGVLSTTGKVVEDHVAPMIKEQFEGLEISLGDAKKEFYSLLEDTGKKKLDPQYLESQAKKSVTDAKEGAKDSALQPGQADAEIEGILSKSRNRFDQSFKALDKQALVNVLVARTDMTEAEANRSVENTFAEFERAREEFDAFIEEAKEKAKVQAEKIAEAMGDAAMYLAIALILGAIAAAVGGTLGVEHLRKDRHEKEFYVEKSDVDVTSR